MGEADAERLSALNAALEAFESQNPAPFLVVALDTISVYLTNLFLYPDDAKYRKIRVNNINYRDRLGKYHGGEDVLVAIGYQPNPKQAGWLVLPEHLPDSQPFLDTLRTFCNKVHQRKDFFKSQMRKDPGDWVAGHAWNAISAAAADDTQGRRNNMEDEHVLIDDFAGPNQAYFGVYDGHGGREVVEYLVKALHPVLEHAIKGNPDHDCRQTFTDCFRDVDTMLRLNEIKTSGSTVGSVFIKNQNGKRTICSANCGDTRTVLCRGSSALRLSCDHKPHTNGEPERIKAAGGYVGRFGRVNGILAVSRAFGDFALKPAVSVDPFYKEVEVQPEDSFLVIACDGLWDVMSDDDVVSFVKERVTDQYTKCNDPDGRKKLQAKLRKTCKELIDEALSRRSLDNISVILVWL